METSSVQARPETLINPAASQRLQTPEKNEPAIETQSDNDQDDSQKVSKETVKLSDTSLKLSANSPVKSSDKPAPIENSAQAQEVASNLKADIENNPVQARGAQSQVFSGAVKSLLG
jgi:hypothetical protein